MARAVWTALLPAILCAQQAAAPDEIRVSSRPYVSAQPFQVETKLMELNVAVRDGSGRAVRGLKREDFQILDGGKEREVASFSEEDIAASASAAAASPSSPPPASAATLPPAQARFVALFIDDVNDKDWAAGADLGRTQTAAKKYLAEALKPGVRIALFTASGTVTQDFTSDAAPLLGALARVKAHIRMSEIGLQFCPRVTPYRAYQIAQLHDRQVVRMVVAETAAYPLGYGCEANGQQVEVEAEETWRKVKEIAVDTLTAIDRVVATLGKMPGQRVLVMASSGFLAQTLEDKQQAVIDHAIHSAVVINSLDSKGMYSEAPPGCRPTDPKPDECIAGDRTYQYETMAVADRLMMANAAMADLAHGTGGEFFHNSNDLHAGLLRLGTPPDVTYRISFSPTGVPADGSYRKLQVTLVHGGNWDVEARPGYFAPTTKPADDPKSKLDREVTASDTMSDFPAGLAVQMRKGSVSVVVRIDVTKLPFAEQDGRKRQMIAFVSALRDELGNVVAAKEGFMELALKPETYDRLAKSGLNAELSFEAAPGRYTLREVVQEELNGSLSASTNPLEVK